MDVTYGQAVFVEGSKRIKGRVILSEHKLFLKGPGGDFTETYIPLEKICLLRAAAGSLHIEAQLTIHLKVSSVLQGNKKSMLELAREIAARRGLKKKFLKNEWIEVA